MLKLAITLAVIINSALWVITAITVGENRIRFYQLKELERQEAHLTSIRDQLLLQKKFDYAPRTVKEFAESNITMQEPSTHQIIWHSP